MPFGLRESRESRAGRENARLVVRTGGFLAVTTLMLGPFVLRMQMANRMGRDSDSVREAWVNTWARSLLRLFAVDVVVDGTLPPRTMRGRLVVSNHRSAIDVGVMLSTFGGVMVSRADLANWPIVGAAARAAGTLFVDRAKTTSGAQVIRAMQGRLEKGQSVCLFPEGTTFDGDEIRPFFGGAFVAAARAAAEVLPVGIAYPHASGVAFVNETFPQHLVRMARSSGVRMALAIGKPFALAKSDRASVVTGRAHDEVDVLVKRARKICGA
ncbi:MAG: 1-acyl-sn-glycerol-3-phosphate acyltransferase [Polyangiaceae bacterium]|nr:1-acyl-sn-glycerol-3-phosphate acyltransferase [Polyangiaceae bacterium]